MNNVVQKIENNYRFNEGNKYHKKKHEVSGPIFDLIAKNRARVLGKYIKGDQNVLEYGIGPGWNLAAINCRSRTGYDIATTFRQKITDLGIRFVDSLDQLKDIKFDTVICSHVLEHVPDPVETLVKIKTLLKDNGTLVLMVPYEVQSQYRKYVENEENHHLFSWNVQTLGALVASCDYEIVEANLEPFGYEYFSSKLANRFKIPWAFRFLINFFRLIKPIYQVKIIAKNV